MRDPQEETRQESNCMNKEQALRCIVLSKEALQRNQTEKAIKFARKSIRLYPSDEAQQLLLSILRKEKKPDYSLMAGIGYLVGIIIVAGLAIHLLYSYYQSSQKSSSFYELEPSSSHSVERKTNQLNVQYYVQDDFTTMFHRKFRSGFDEFQREIEKKKLSVLKKKCQEIKEKLDLIGDKKDTSEDYVSMKEQMKRICKEKRDLKNSFNSAYRTDL